MNMTFLWTLSCHHVTISEGGTASIVRCREGNVPA